jgi:hypothetical protein
MIDIIYKVLKVFADANLFEEGVELVGSWCFWLYQQKLGVKSFPLRTQDVDFLIPNPYRGRDNEKFLNQLQELGFNREFNNDGSMYLWNEELKIEFITPEKGRGVDSAIKIRKLGINAIPLRYVSLLLDNPISITEKRLKILVPNPVNFCLQKLLIASRRRKAEKALKDLEQAICTSVILTKAETQKTFNSLPAKWQRSILKVLAKSKTELPLLIEEIDRLKSTLQNLDNKAM